MNVNDTLKRQINRPIPAWLALVAVVLPLTLSTCGVAIAVVTERAKTIEQVKNNTKRIDKLEQSNSNNEKLLSWIVGRMGGDVSQIKQSD